ncbi:MAG: class I SAM-dependent methyltransferase [Haloarculaceae archaeon]
MADPFGRAVRDHHRGERDAPLVQRDGEATLEHPVEEFYFTEPGGEGLAWLDSWLEGSLLDLGAGAGRHALVFQERVETVAVEVSDALVETMRERGVDDARFADMFHLRAEFDRDRFGSVLANGTQAGLAGSIRGLRELLGDLAYVTGPDGTGVLDCYDPAVEATADLLGYRSDPTPGLAHRVMQFEYEGETGDILYFRLFSPDRLREAAAGTGWAVDDVRRSDEDGGRYYRAALVKR